ncbi:MAG: site-specific DNA-methyltransferase [Acetatifactor sp.]
MKKSGKLELTWVGKYEEEELEPRILLEDKSKSYGEPESDNMLIHGDNLFALKALQSEYCGRIKCIYIDPPYNTGSAFEQYDDSLEHSIWLSLMKKRLLLLHDLLQDDGSIWISIDDDEQAYLKVLCDEVFGRKNFVANVIWEKKYSPQNDAKWLSDSHDFIMVYAKNKDIWRPNLLPRTDEMNKRYKNPDNDPRGPWKPGDVLVKSFSPTGVFGIVNPNTGEEFFPPEGSCYRFNRESAQRMLEENRFYFGKDGKGAPQVKRFLSDVKQGMVSKTIWKREEVGDNQEAKNEVRRFNSGDAFATPKPERLIERILLLATKEGDLVLDSFLGSGTTAAVAHKMRRKWIGIELGEHAYTHCKLRMDKVIDGDQGGISKEVNWQGGGGYRFYELAEPLLVKHPKLPFYQVNPSYTWEMMCEAICKIEGFKYCPNGEYQGYSSENRYIHITEEFVNGKYILGLTKTLGERQSVLIYCKKHQADMVLPVNVEVRRIPKDLLEKCSFESEEEA